MSTSKSHSKKSHRHRSPSPDDYSDSYSDSSDEPPPPPPSKKKSSKSSRAVVSDDDSYSRRRSTRDPVDEGQVVKRRETRAVGDDSLTRSTRGDDRHRSSRHRDRDRDSDDESYSKSRRRRHRRDDYDSRSRSRSRSDHEDEDTGHSKKNIIEDVLGALGLVGAEKALTKNHSSSSRSGGHHSSSRQEEIEDKSAQRKQALQAAVTAAAVEAWRTRKDKNSTPAQRMMRIASAAIAAGGIDAFVDKKPDSHSMRHIAEAVVGGLVTSKAVGPKIRRTGGMRAIAMDSIVGRAAGAAFNSGNKSGRSSSTPRRSSRRDRSP